jgi:hypothetical protein
MMDKNAIERICRSVGLVPEKRVRVGDAEVFVADGRSSPPHMAYRRFGIAPDDFPGGCYVTLWWVSKGEDLDTGQPLFFELFHNPEYSGAAKKMARINTAVREASGFLNRRKAVHALAS